MQEDESSLLARGVDNFKKGYNYIDIVTAMFPKPVVEAHSFLSDLVDNAIDHGVGVPGILDDPNLMNRWLEHPSDQEAKKAHDRLLQYAANFYNVEEKQIRELIKARVDAFFDE